MSDYNDLNPGSAIGNAIAIIIAVLLGLALFAAVFVFASAAAWNFGRWASGFVGGL